MMSFDAYPWLPGMLFGGAIFNMLFSYGLLRHLIGLLKKQSLGLVKTPPWLRLMQAFIVFVGLLTGPWIVTLVYFLGDFWGYYWSLPGTAFIPLSMLVGILYALLMWKFTAPKLPKLILVKT